GDLKAIVTQDAHPIKTSGYPKFDAGGHSCVVGAWVRARVIGRINSREVLVATEEPGRVSALLVVDRNRLGIEAVVRGRVGGFVGIDHWSGFGVGSTRVKDEIGQLPLSPR